MIPAVWGAVGAALVIGALAAMYFDFSVKVLGSVMAIGAKNCNVTVGKKSLGVAPFFKKSSPSGACQITLACEEGKEYTTTLKLKNGASEKLIVKEGMWK